VFRNRVAYLVAASVLMVTIPASAGTKFTPYPDRKASDCSAKIEKAGLVVGAQPVDDTRDQKSYFGTELTAKGYLPVFVVVENKSTTDTFFFDKSNLAQAAASGGAVKDARSKTGETMAIIAMGGVGGLIAMKMISNATAVQENMLKNEIQTKTLSPGTSVHGFLYIPIPKEGARGGIHLQIPMVNAQTSEMQVVNLTF